MGFYFELFKNGVFKNKNKGMKSSIPEKIKLKKIETIKLKIKNITRQ